MGDGKDFSKHLPCLDHPLETITNLKLRTAFTTVRLHDNESLSIQIRQTNILGSDLTIYVCTWGS
ncbi:hypothetical protein Plhal703r1_c25g0106021 [Plasmopara halstedii]